VLSAPPPVEATPTRASPAQPTNVTINVGLLNVNTNEFHAALFSPAIIKWGLIASIFAGGLISPPRDPTKRTVSHPPILTGWEAEVTQPVH
jgi:hypothetical protein